MMAKKNPTAAPTPAPDLLTEEMALADGGEAASVFLHELGNVLNNLLLNARLMQRQLPEEFRDRVGESCKLIGGVAVQMQHLAKFRQTRRSPPYSVDLSAAARAVADELNVKPGRVTTELGGPALVTG